MNATAASLWRRIETENGLWLLLALFLTYLDPHAWNAWSVACGSLVTALSTQPSLGTLPIYWRRQQGQGYCMSSTLIPILLHGMGSRWIVYGKLTSILWIQVYSSAAAAATTTALLVVIDEVSILQVLLVTCMYVLTYSSIKWYSSLHNVFTQGEWMLVTVLGSIAVTEWVLSEDMPLYAHVALSGVLGCTLACAITPCIANLYRRVMLLVSISLFAAEAALWWQEPSLLVVPRSVSWLTDFLLEDSDNTWSFPRGAWLVYWAVCLVGAFVLSPPNPRNICIARKWFHLVGAVLFFPVTLMDSTMMSLSYAIALCLLGMLECLRSELGVLQSFYTRFMDPQKDLSHKVVISHMSLILGCAIPLWIHQCTTSSHSMLVPVFGILVLGVGDSLAAIVGSLYGETKWNSAGSRTVEGSTAMWLGMALCCCLCGSDHCWMAAVTFTTLLEAVTTQIDNIVLPLGGVAVLLLLQQKS